MYKKIKEQLAKGERVTIRPSGNSMKPLIKNKEQITISPVDPKTVEKGDIVLAKVKGRHYIHLVTATKGDNVQISNNHGRVNGWASRSNIYGIVRREDIGDNK